MDKARERRRMTATGGRKRTKLKIIVLNCAESKAKALRREDREKTMRIEACEKRDLFCKTADSQGLGNKVKDTE